jgi:putative transposase
MMIRATKVRLYPTAEQVEFLNRQFGAVRFVYNKALFLKTRFYQRTGTSLSPIKDLKPMLSVAKKSRKYAWLKDHDSMALQQAILNLGNSFKNFFEGRSGYPKFKNRYGDQSSYHCTALSVGADWVKIPKLKSPIPAVVHREIKGQIKSITLSRTTTGKYFASILVDDGESAPAPISDIAEAQVVGIDLGLKHYYTDSNAVKVANPRFLANALKNLRVKQKTLSRAAEGSAGRKKARLAVGKAHERVTNARSDFLHKLTRRLVDENQAIIVETLKVKNMVKNRKLARHISDAAWGKFGQFLSYKAADAGKRSIKIDPWYPSSKTCNCCGLKREFMGLSVRVWTCEGCRTVHDRDENAATNIKLQGLIALKAAGLVVSANRGLVSPA